jgi:L-2-hydroxyglutarate oxidase LhgO
MLSRKAEDGMVSKLKLQTHKKYSQKYVVQGAGEMAQWLRALTTLSGVLRSIPSKYMVAHNHL